MGKIRSSRILLEGNSVGVYRPGESIKGTAILEVDGEIKINTVKVECVGRAVTKWKAFLARWYEDDNCSTETYKNTFYTLVDKDTEVLTEGTHKYKFSFALPKEGLPSSFEGHYGSVRYWLRVIVDKKFPGINHDKYKNITVLANIDTNAPEYKKAQGYRVQKTISKALGLGNAGTVTLRANTDRGAYCPGEKIKIFLTATNESEKTCGSVKATLVQYVFFKAGNSTEDRTWKIIFVSNHKNLDAGQTENWVNQTLTVPAVPPSTSDLSCHIIKVSYRLLVEVEVKMGFNVELTIPITIGTIPHGMSLASTVPFSYRQCESGLEQFDKSEGDFLNSDFKPMTVVANTAQTSPQQTAVQQKPTVVVSVKNLQTSQKTPGTPTKPTGATAKTLTQESSKPIGAVAIPLTKESEKPNIGSTATTSKPNPKVVKSTPKQGDTYFTAMSKEVKSGDTEVKSTFATPSAPPIYDEGSAPPSYEETMSIGPQTHAISGATILTPYHNHENTGNGALMLLIFPSERCQEMQECFRSSVPNLILHDGQILAFSRETTLLPGHSNTSAILLFFPSQKASLSWLQNQQTTFKEFSKSWWTLVGENSSHYKKSGISTPRAPTLDGAVRISLSKKSNFKASKDIWTEFSHEAAAVKPLSVKYKSNKILVAASALRASGDWSGFPCNATESCVMAARQFDVVEQCQGFVQELYEGEGTSRFLELMRSLYDVIATDVLSTKDIALFKN